MRDVFGHDRMEPVGFIGVEGVVTSLTAPSGIRIARNYATALG